MNKYQRATLIGIGLLIAIIQLDSIVEHGLDENRGWTLALIISAVLLFVGFGAWGGFSLHSLRAIFFGQNIGLKVGTESAQPLGVEGEGLKSYVTENVRILNMFTEKVSKELFQEAEHTQTNRGSLANVMSSLVRSPLLLYAFSLLTISKLRHNPSYFSADEYKKTKELVILQAFAAELRDMNIEPKDPIGMKLLNGVVDDIKCLEDGAKDFFDQMNQGNIKVPALKINAWLRSQTGFEDTSPMIKGKSLDEFTKDNLHVIYDMIYVGSL